MFISKRHDEYIEQRGDDSKRKMRKKNLKEIREEYEEQGGNECAGERDEQYYLGERVADFLGENNSTCFFP